MQRKKPVIYTQICTRAHAHKCKQTHTRTLIIVFWRAKCPMAHRHICRLILHAYARLRCATDTAPGATTELYGLVLDEGWASFKMLGIFHRRVGCGFEEG